MADTIRDLRDVPWAQVEAELLRDPRITPQCKALYSLLITYGPRRIFPSQQTLGECLGVSRQTIKAWLDELKALELIAWTPRNGSSNEYDILGYANLRPVKPTLQGCKASLTPPVKPTLHDPDPVIQIQELSPAIAEKTWEHAVTAEMTDVTDLAVMCPECDEPITLAQLDKIRAECPSCKIPLWVKDTMGTAAWKPLQKYRVKSNGLIPWTDLPVRGWCALAGTNYDAMPRGTKFALAKLFKEVGDTPEQVYDALREFKHMHQWWTYWEWPSTKFLGMLAMDIARPAQEEPPPAQILAYDPNITPEWMK